MTAYYDTLIVTFSDPIRILDMMFTDTCDVATLKEWIESYEPYKRTYGSHHFRIQHGACGGMAQKIYPHCRNERIQRCGGTQYRPHPKQTTHKKERA